MTSITTPASESEREERREALRNARSTAHTVGHLLMRRQVYVRKSSIARPDVSDKSMMPTFTRLACGSGTGQTPLKLYLLLLWMAGSEGGGDGATAHIPPSDPNRLIGPYTTQLDYHVIADLLLEPRFTGRAADPLVRKVAAAAERLEGLKLIDLSEDRLSIRLLSEDGRGEAYYNPGSFDDRDKDEYVRLPPEFFTRGWFSALPSYAIYALLLYRYRQPFDTPPKRGSGSYFFNETMLQELAPISTATMQRGNLLLSRWGLLEVDKQVFAGKGHRSRNLYRPRFDKLKRQCPDELPPKR